MHRRMLPSALRAAAALAIVGLSIGLAIADGLKRLAFVSPVSSSTVLSGEAAFWARLRELGWIEGSNVTYATYFANGDSERLVALMQEAVQAKPDVLVTPGTAAAAEAKRATKEIPIVGLMTDPTDAGLVANLARSGSNLTGLSVQNADVLPPKWLEIVRELQPRITHLGLLVNAGSPVGKVIAERLGASAAAVNIKLVVLEAKTVADLPKLIEQARQQVQAVIVPTGELAIQSRTLIAKLAREQKLPVLYAQSDFVDAGGLISYGPDLAALWRRLAEYADKILKGANPAELPIEQPVAFDLVINVRAAKEIGVRIPRPLLDRATRVVQ
jgi:putative ABC transport system substrate-binding protein